MTTLQHHGIKGQKWGIRRFRNKDGLLTAAGKRREKKLKGDEISKRLYKKAESMGITEESDNNTAKKWNQLMRDSDQLRSDYTKRYSNGATFVAALASASAIALATKHAVNTGEMSVKKMAITGGASLMAIPMTKLISLGVLKSKQAEAYKRYGI